MFWFCKTDHKRIISDFVLMLFQENILVSQVERPLPKLDYYGAPTNRSESPDLLPALHPDLHPASVEDQTLRSQLIRDREPSSTKRKSSELETTEEEVMITKRGCQSLPSSSSSLEVGAFPLQGMAEWESELLNRQQQEEEDRQLALLLQKELDKEEKQRATNRRKGSADAYLLRQNQGGKVESTDTPSQPSRKTTRTSTTSSSSSPFLKTTKTSSPSSSSSSSRGSKQTTLTEMFSSLSRWTLSLSFCTVSWCHRSLVWTSTCWVQFSLWVTLSPHHFFISSMVNKNCSERS